MTDIERFALIAGTHTKEMAAQIAGEIAASLVNNDFKDVQWVQDTSCSLAVGIVSKLGLFTTR